MSKPLLILYATMTGNAEWVAHTIATAAQGRGFAPDVASVTVFHPSELAEHPRVILAASTWGEGEPPSDAEEFTDALKALPSRWLENVRFAIYALGDQSYDQFCGYGRWLDAEFERLGARRIAERAETDLDYEEGLAAWIETVLQGFADTEPVLAG